MTAPHPHAYGEGGRLRFQPSPHLGQPLRHTLKDGRGLQSSRSNASSRAKGSGLMAAHLLGVILAGLVVLAIVAAVVRIGAGSAFTGFAVLAVLVVLGACGLALLGGRVRP